MLKNKTIIITQASEDAGVFKEILENRGLKVYEFPSIRFRANPRDAKMETAASDPNSYNLIVFTSRHAALFFNQTFKENDWQKIPTVAIGEITEEALDKIGDVKGKRILLPRSQLADDTLIKILEAQGANVTPFILYTTEFVEGSDEKLERMLIENSSDFCATFTSPSTISGFARRLKKSTLQAVFKEVPAVCIGPTTAEAARVAGFKHVLTAEPHTLEGIANVLTSHAIS